MVKDFWQPLKGHSHTVEMWIHCLKPVVHFCLSCGSSRQLNCEECINSVYFPSIAFKCLCWLKCHHLWLIYLSSFISFQLVLNSCNCCRIFSAICWIFYFGVQNFRNLEQHHWQIDTVSINLLRVCALPYERMISLSRIQFRFARSRLTRFYHVFFRRSLLCFFSCFHGWKHSELFLAPVLGQTSAWDQIKRLDL
jgi:hypothetical protein